MENLPLTLDPDTLARATFLVSYPRSGNTWARFLIGNYLSNGQCDFSNISDLVPSVYESMTKNIGMIQPLVIKSHSHYTPHFRKVIYLARNGVDVLISFYYFCCKFLYDKDTTITLEDYLDLFNHALFPPLNSFGKWSDHIHGWLDQSTAELLFLRYEDMIENTPKALRSILTFLEVDIDEDRITQAVEASQIHRLRMLEDKDQFNQWLARMVPESIVERSNSSPLRFIRDGKLGEGYKYITPTQLETFYAYHASAMLRLGYLQEEPWHLLRNSETHLQSTRQELAQTPSQLQSTQQELAQMKRSKFWKMRNLWFKVRNKLGMR